MSPEIRAAVKTLAAAFQTITEALAREEAPRPTAPAPPRGRQGHEFYWKLDRYGGGAQPCCAWHAERLERAFRRPEAVEDPLGGEHRRYVRERDARGPPPLGPAWDG